MKYVLIVEDHSVVRLATKFILNELIGPVTVFEASDFAETLSLVSIHDFDLILLDIDVPAGEGILMVTKIRGVHANVPILIFTSMDESIYTIHYLKAGANGFLSKNTSISDFKEAILAVISTGRYISREAQQLLFRNNEDGLARQSNPLETLSQREVEVMDLLLQGLWTKEIAMKLNITISSVSTYKSRIFEKLNVTTLIDLYVLVEFFRNRLA